MWFVISLLLSILLLLSWVRWRQSKKLLKQLADAVKVRHPIVIGDQLDLWRETHLYDLALSYRNLLKAADAASRSESNRLQQIDTTLKNIREAVFMLDEQNRIVLANTVAETFWGKEFNLVGQRIETVLPNSKIIELVGAIRKGVDTGFQEMEFRRGKQEDWFEVSGALVGKSGQKDEGQEFLLLVMHDISRLKNLERVRKDFVANVSHELRTPLTIVKGFTETLVEDHSSLPLETRERFLSKIQNNINRLHLTVEDLLTLSRLESNPDQVQLKPGSFHQLIRDVCDNFQDKLTETDRTLKLKLESNPDVCLLDARKLRQVIENLLDNSLRYAGPDAQIQISTEFIEFRNLLRCSVSDNGIGVPDRDIPFLFQRFYRVDKGRSRVKGGTGLGLSIAKHIIQLHGGEIWAESKLGDGLKIHFTLKLA